MCLLGIKFITTINSHRHFPLGFILASAEKPYDRIVTQGWDLAERPATTARIKEAQNRNLLRKDIRNWGCADQRERLKLKGRRAEAGGKR